MAEPTKADENKTNSGAPVAAVPPNQDNNAKPGTTEYYLLDLMYHKTNLGEDGEPKGTPKRYRQGDVVTLTDDEAEPLLRDPLRPSIVNKADEDKRLEKLRKRMEEDTEDGD